MNWRDFLTPEEIARLAELQDQHLAAQREKRRIWDRCRKRMERNAT